MDAIWNDLRFAVRSLRTSRTFSLVAMLTLAVGIGANTAVFSVVNAILLKPLPYADPDRLVFLTQTAPEGSSPVTSPTKYQFCKERATTVEDLAAFHLGFTNLTDADRPEQVGVAYASAGFFRLFGARFVLGRGFSAADDRPHGDNVAVMSEALWRRRFGADPALLGKTIRLNGHPTTVVGILGGEFDGTAVGGPFAAVDVYLPLQLDMAENANGNFLTAAGRLAPHARVEGARAELQRLGDEFRGMHPSFLRVQDGFGVERAKDVLVGDVRPILLLFTAAVGLVLLIACANVASLLMARATSRAREMAIRMALGADRSRILRQLLTESMLLASIAGSIGVVGGVAAVRAILAIRVAQLPRVGADAANLTVDVRVLLFTVIVSLATGIAFGLLPGWRASRQDGAHALGNDRVGSIAASGGARGILMSAQIAVAVVLLVGALLLIRSLVALRGVAPGFGVQGVLTARMSLSEPRFATTAAVNALIDNALDRVRAVPGVAAAGAACCLPLQDAPMLRVNIVGRRLDGAYHVMAGWRMVSPGYFDVFAIPVVRGRRLTNRDDRGGAPVVLINDAMAHRFWPGSNPLHEHLEIGKGLGPEFADAPREIVGVVADVHDVGLSQPPIPTVYVPLAQLPDPLTALHFHMLPIAWVVRTNTTPIAVASALEQQLQQASGGVPVTHVAPMNAVLARSTAQSDFNTALMTGFAVAAVLLAGTGIFGVVAYSVQQRRHEIAVRVACGAGSGDVRRLIVWGSMRYVLAGALIGLAAAFGATRVLASLLFGVTVHDAASFVAAPVLMTAVALLAVWGPTRQALRVDPAVMLRGD